MILHHLVRGARHAGPASVSVIAPAAAVLAITALSALSTPAAAAAAPDPGALAPQFGITTLDVPFEEGDTGSVELVWLVSSPVPTPEDCTAEVVVVPGQSTASLVDDVEIDDVNGILVGAGQTTALVTASAFGDTLVEGDETVTVELRPASISGFPACPIATPTTATLTIIDDDRPTITLVAPEDVVEGNAGTRPMTFRVEANAPMPDRCEIAVIVRVAGAPASEVLRGGVAAIGQASADDVVASGPSTVVFDAGDTSATITVQVVGDTVVEDDEQVTVEVVPAPGTLPSLVAENPSCAADPTTSTALILNDDEPLVEEPSPTSTTTATTTTVPAPQPQPEVVVTTTSVAPTTTLIDVTTTAAPTTTVTSTTIAPEVLSQSAATTLPIPVAGQSLPTTGSDGSAVTTLGWLSLGLGVITMVVARLRRRA